MHKIKKKENDKIKEPGIMQAFAFVSGIGIHFVVLIGVCIFFGRMADQYFQVRPWGTLFGIILGFSTGIWSIYKKILGK